MTFIWCLLVGSLGLQTKCIDCMIGLVHQNCVNIIGNGCVVHIPSFFEEIDKAEAKGINTKGRVFLSDRAHIVFDFHMDIDGLKEEELGRGSIGTTRKGIGPVYSSKASRGGIRVGDLLFEDWRERFAAMVKNKTRVSLGAFSSALRASH